MSKETDIRDVARATAEHLDWLYENVQERLDEWLIRKFYQTDHGLSTEEFLQAVEMGAGPEPADNLKETIAP